MKKGAGGRSPAASPVAPKRLKYEEVRDLFLKEPPATDEEALDFFAQLGMFIYGRWQSISADTPDGEPLDEDGSPRWNDCTDREFEEIRARAEDLIDREVARRRLTAFMASVLKEPGGTIYRVLSWVFMTALEGFVGAIGIVLFGLVVLWLVPHLVKEMRSAVNDALPSETRPTDLPNATNAAASDTAHAALGAQPFHRSLPRSPQTTKGGGH